MQRSRRVAAFLIVPLAFALWLAGCAPAASPSGVGGGASAAGADAGVAAQPLQTRTLFVFDTVVTLSCHCPEDLMDAAAERCEYFERHLSRTVEGSDVWNINHAHGRPVEVAPETADLIARSLAYCEESGGLLDITIGCVTPLWDFDAGVRPDDGELAEAASHIGYRGVHVEGTTVTLDDPGCMIDLGGTAKGYIADDLVRLFREGGCGCGTINLGGNAYAIGKKPDGSEWNVGIQDPGGPGQESIAKIACSDASVVTSGLYERCFEQDGRLYHHILDPSTGYPAQTDLASVSIVGESSLQGDAYATWMLLLGRDKALATLEAAGIEALLIGQDGSIAMTEGARFTLL